MINTFKIGDRVRVLPADNSTYLTHREGREGKVTALTDAPWPVSVDLDGSAGEACFDPEELALVERTSFDISLSEKQLRILIDLVGDWPGGEINDPDVAPVAGEVQRYTYTGKDRAEIHDILISAGTEEDSGE